MKLQFSLVTLLVCMTVLAVVAAFCKALPVKVPAHTENIAITSEISRQLTQRGIRAAYGQTVPALYPAESHPVKVNEFAWRLAWAAPLSIAGTLAVLWLIRRLKSRRENGPSVG